MCASESGYRGVGEIKKKEQEFRKSYEIYLRKWEILIQKRKKKRKYYIDVMLIYLKIYNVSIREKTYNKINMWREKIIKNFA